MSASGLLSKALDSSTLNFTPISNISFIGAGIPYNIMAIGDMVILSGLFGAQLINPAVQASFSIDLPFAAIIADYGLGQIVGSNGTDIGFGTISIDAGLTQAIGAFYHIGGSAIAPLSYCYRLMYKIA